jgi:hypothetical protein
LTASRVSGPHHDADLVREVRLAKAASHSSREGRVIVGAAQGGYGSAIPDVEPIHPGVSDLNRETLSGNSTGILGVVVTHPLAAESSHPPASAFVLSNRLGAHERYGDERIVRPAVFLAKGKACSTLSWTCRVGVAGRPNTSLRHSRAPRGCETCGMQSATLRALADVGTYRDEAGNVRLYHATSAAAATSILEGERLLPKEPVDVAERLVLRGRGLIFLASSASIGRDLPHGSVALAVDVAADKLPEAPLRERFGDPPRVELQLTIPMSDSLPLR